MDSKINNDIDSSSSDSTSKPSTTSIRTNNKQKVPFTLKYQLNIRKNSNDSSSTVNSPLPIGAQSGLLADLTFDQDKGQFLWATEGYQQNLKKRRVTNNSNTGGNSSPKPYDMCKVPRPPNAFIIYHRNKSKELAKFKSNGKSESNERHPSKTVAEMWKEEPAEIKLQYQREADLALVEHKKKYPFYKYKPKKKDGKNKSKSQQVNNKTSKNKKSSSIKSSNDNKDNKKEISNEDDDSQVPIEHRKQAAMESAFTVFDLDTPKENSNNNNNSPHSPTNNITMSNPQVMTPIWTDYDKQFFDSPINERLNYSPLQLPSPQPQSQSQQQQPPPPCQCTTHCVNNNNNNNNGVASIASVTTALETLSSEQWNAVSEIFSNVLECMGVMPHCNNPTTPIEATPTSIAPISGMSGISPSGRMSQTSITGIDITTPTTTLDNMMMTTFNTDYFQITAHDWNDMDIDDMGDIATNYVVPSQSASESVPPPTPTSPTDYLSWATSTHQSIDSQFAVADPITNVTEQFSQINQATNDNLFTSADNDNICTLFNSDFDSDFNFTL
ncbi:hypothetical protein C1646_744679 [Rhizophagus diaphanus]|nr:hypothetical protein C1646_744679 [Rhizophagus diaphanus] [Rhizophagus sp. MUCL 43196]